MSNIVSIIRSAIETGSYDLSCMLVSISYLQAHVEMSLEDKEGPGLRIRLELKIEGPDHG